MHSPPPRLLLLRLAAVAIPPARFDRGGERGGGEWPVQCPLRGEAPSSAGTDLTIGSPPWFTRPSRRRRRLLAEDPPCHDGRAVSPNRRPPCTRTPLAHTSLTALPSSAGALLAQTFFFYFSNQKGRDTKEKVNWAAPGYNRCFCEPYQGGSSSRFTCSRKVHVVEIVVTAKVGQ